MQSVFSLRAIILIVLFVSVVGAQVGYDRVQPAVSSGTESFLNPEMIRMIDFGFHAAFASGFWVSAMPEILDLFRGRTEYLAGRAFVNSIDPKLAYPYAFSVLTLPAVGNFPSRVTDAIAIGAEGIAKGDPDWRIPYYMAIDYYLELKDLKNATWYFNLAANTPGVPQYAARFGLNFGINQRERDRVRNLWATVYQSTNDPAAKARAAAYVERLNDFDYLEAAAQAYKEKFGSYPSSTDELVSEGVISEAPQDPFGFSFVINKDGSAGIDLTKLPSYLLNQPSQ